MLCSIKKDKNAVIFTIEGDIDEQGANALKNEFENLSLKGLKSVSFDFAKVPYIGSSGLGKLLLFYKKLAASNAEMNIDNCNPEIIKLLEELNLDTLFKIS